MNRRDFLTRLSAGTAAFGLAGLVRPFGRALAAEPAGTPLSVVSRTLEVNGRAARVFGLTRPGGAPGLVLNSGETFDVALVNESAEPTLVHWHGLTPPWEQDGVPGNPAALLEPGGRRDYNFPLRASGTYWMHAHTLQEQQLLAAPLIVHSADDARRDEQEVVVLLHDFSFHTPEELLAGLRGNSGAGGMNMGGMNMGGMAGMSHMTHGAMPAAPPAMSGGHSGMGAGMGGGMGGMAMDLNDIEYDAYLANDRTLDDPEVIPVEAGGRVRLRIINGATATAFTIDTGTLDADLIAVDGQEIAPLPGQRFPVSMGQRVDLRLRLPKEGGAFPVLALREGAPERTGIILATAGAPIRKVATSGTENGPVLDLSLERRLRPVQPLAVRPADRRFTLMLTGNMASYDWTIAGAGDGLGVAKGDRVEVSMHNMSMMAHPMHLHGHHFQVVEIDGTRLPGAMRDTVLVPPMATVTVAFDADNPGRWPLHCHHLYHMATGMMTMVTVA